MEIYIDNRQNKLELDDNMYKILEEVVEECLLLEKKSTNYEISISLVDNKEIRELNREYRNMDSETDVLSFPLDQEFGEVPMLGDIVISLERALEQSIEYGHSLTREVAYLTAHSMFHLMGYDHMEEDEKHIMREKEKEIMKRLRIFKDEEGE